MTLLKKDFRNILIEVIINAALNGKVTWLDIALRGYEIPSELDYLPDVDYITAGRTPEGTFIIDYSNGSGESYTIVKDSIVDALDAFVEFFYKLYRK